VKEEISSMNSKLSMIMNVSSYIEYIIKMTKRQELGFVRIAGAMNGI
jgi:hypothetical protein